MSDEELTLSLKGSLKKPVPPALSVGHDRLETPSEIHKARKRWRD